MGTIRIEGSGLSATCETPEQAAALWRLLESQTPRATEATSLADEPAPRKRNGRAPKAPASNGSGGFRLSPKGGRQPSPLTIAVYDAISKFGDPDVELLAKSNGVEVKAINQILWRGVGNGRLKKLSGGGYKVIG